MINLQVRSENGTIEARAKHGVVWGPELASLDQSVFPMLGHLLPYADTVFNHRQVSTLLEECFYRGEVEPRLRPVREPVDLRRDREPVGVMVWNMPLSE